MVTFVSLFLWLVTGVQTVEVATEAPVARVEFQLDGELVGELTDDRRKIQVDFGPTLEPHELVAIAYDASGAEIDRARQVINLPSPPVVATLVVDHDETGRPVAARVVTESATRLAPVNIVVSLDGDVIAPDAKRRYPLPKFEPRTTHLLSAEALWADGSAARTDLSLGGDFGEIVASELTAIPIRISREEPSIEEIQGRLTAGGEPLRVVAVETSGARIYVVRDLGATRALKAVGRSNARVSKSIRAHYDPVFEHDLAPDLDRAYLVGVNAAAARGVSLFPVAGPVSLKRWGLPWAVTTLHDRYPDPDSQRVADAVAVAGIRAAGHASPRTVVLILSAQTDDDSVYPVTAVKHFLAEIGVPLVVWVAHKQTDNPWGPGTKTTSPKDFSRATEALLDELADQRIVWVEGRHLLNRVELDGADLGLTLAGD
jgi:hypothetical protein